MDKKKMGAPFTATAAGLATERAIRGLAPANETQRLYQSQSIQALNSILQTRLVIYEKSGTYLPVPFLAVLIFWLFVLFASFSLFSPLSPTAFAAIVVIALSRGDLPPPGNVPAVRRSDADRQCTRSPGPGAIGRLEFALVSIAAIDSVAQRRGLVRN